MGHGSLATPLQGGLIGADAAGGVVTAGLATGDGPTKLVVVRYRTDGTLDPSFGDRGVSFTPATDGMMVSAVAVYGDGRVVVGGSVARGQVRAFAATRLRSDGSLDPTFGTGGTVTTQVGQAVDAVVALEPLPGGRLVVAGGAPPSNGDAAIALLRYRDDGTLDPAFGKGGVVFSPLPEQPHDISAQVLAATFDAQGRIVFAGNMPRPTPEGQPFREAPFLARYLADGSPDSAFGTDGMVVGSFDRPAAAAVAVLPDGGILASGELWSGADGTVTVTRYRDDGSLDSSFGVQGSVALGPFSSGYTQPRLVACPDASSIVFVDEGVANNKAVGTLRRLRPDGSLDASYGAAGGVATSRISGLVTLPDGTVAIVGARSGLAADHYLADGTKDPAFDHDVASSQASGAAAIALGPGDAVVTAGWAQRGNRRVVELARFLGNGQLDPDFGTGGLADTAVGDGDAEATAVVRLTDGRLLAAGAAGDSGVLLRYTDGGTPDLTFGTGGVVVGRPGPVRALALQADGSILAAGGAFSISRYLSDGRVDTSFGTAGTSTPIPGAQARALTVQPDGRILVAGTKDGSFVVVRLLQNGTLDPSFAAPGSVAGPGGAAQAIVLQADGRILVTGDRFAIARYEADGSRDPTFGVDGVATPPVDGGRAHAIVPQPDGKIAIGGSSGTAKSVIARVDEFGYLDETYGMLNQNHGVVTGDPGDVSALALGNDRIVAAGTTTVNGTPSTTVDWYIEQGDTAPVDGAAIVALHGTKARPVTRIRTTSPALSPDRKSLAFVSVASGRPELYVVPVMGGKPRRLTTSPFGKESVVLGRVSWSPDGRTIAFDAAGHVADPRCTRACLTTDVYAIAPDGSRLRRLVSGGTDAAWSADGKYLAYRTVPSTGTGSTFVASADGGSPRRVGPGLDEPLWSPRADVLAYSTGTGFALSRADGRRLRVFEGASSPAWAPNGRQLAALTNYAGVVVIVSLSGGRARTLMGGYALRALSWSPDGSRIALFGTRHDVWALIVRASRTGHLLRRQYGYKASTPPLWSADGSTLYIGG